MDDRHIPIHRIHQMCLAAIGALGVMGEFGRELVEVISFKCDGKENAFNAKYDVKIVIVEKGYDSQNNYKEISRSEHGFQILERPLRSAGDPVDKMIRTIVHELKQFLAQQEKKLSDRVLTLHNTVHVSMAKLDAPRPDKWTQTN